MIGVGKCPICGKDSVEKTKPFCSSRCAMLDLGRWLDEGYKIPDDDEGEAFQVPAVGDSENS